MSDSQSWDDYWSGSQSGVAFNSEGAQHPLLATFWAQVFAEVPACGRLLDVASGRGAVLEYLAAARLTPAEIIATDYSAAGLSSLKGHYPAALTVVADASKLPLVPAAMDLVVSQFGVEYAGLQALHSLPELVASGGRLIIVSHAEGSLIYEECRANHQALTELQALNFLPYAEDMFQSGYQVIRGQIGRKEAGAMARRVIEPFNGLRSIMDKYGEEVAGGTIRTLYEETARIQQRFQYHLEEEVMGWIRTMKHEVTSYMGRMESMMNAALSAQQIEDLARDWSAQGLTMEVQAPLMDESERQLAWALRALKS